MDVEGLLWGIIIYAVAFFISIIWYKNHYPLHKNVFSILVFCCVGHYVATFFYSQIISDSLIQFFDDANVTYFGFGTAFVKNMTWYVRQYLTGNSYLGTLYFFSAFSYLGSVLWYMLYLKLAQYLHVSNPRYIFPAVVIMLWPSWLFFTSGIGKDSMCFFAIPMLLLAWNQLIYEKRINFATLFNFIFSLGLFILIRPYLLMIFVGANFFALVDFKKLSLGRLFFVLLLLPIGYYTIQWVMGAHGRMEDIDVTDIMMQAVRQQEYQNIGTSFPMLSNDPVIVLLSLPYSFIMNLIMPLFIFANNTIGLLASFENLFLTGLLYRLWAGRKYFKVVRKKYIPVRLCFCFFVVGMCFLGFINTNLGLAMRQKSMYVPALLILIMLMRLCEKQNRTLQQGDGLNLNAVSTKTI